MYYSRQTKAERAHSDFAWRAMFAGATSHDPLDPVEDEIDPEPVMACCPDCEGTGVKPGFGGHGRAMIPWECRMCEGAGEVPESEL